MGLSLFLVFALSLFVVVATVDAESPMEVYWKAVLGNVAMPKAITENLEQGDGRVHVAFMLDVFIGNYTGHRIRNADSKDDSATSMFFKETDLFIGKRMYVHFRKENEGMFLPRQLATSIPFSSKKLPQILAHFSLKQDSVEARLMERTLEKCEAEVAARGGDSYCATSLESMIDYTTARLGTNLKAISSTTPSGTGMEYTITRVTVLGDHHSSLSCHKASYPYAVFFCHQQPETVPYMVSMVGKDGTEVEIVATCHRDTSQWSENFLGLQVLKVKRGATVCHFNGEHDVLWLRAV